MFKKHAIISKRCRCCNPMFQVSKLIYECFMIMLMLCKSSYARLTPEMLQRSLIKSAGRCTSMGRWWRRVPAQCWSSYNPSGSAWGTWFGSISPHQIMWPNMKHSSTAYASPSSWASDASTSGVTPSWSSAKSWRNRAATTPRWLSTTKKSDGWRTNLTASNSITS